MEKDVNMVKIVFMKLNTVFNKYESVRKFEDTDLDRVAFMFSRGYLLQFPTESCWVSAFSLNSLIKPRVFLFFLFYKAITFAARTGPCPEQDLTKSLSFCCFLYWAV